MKGFYMLEVHGAEGISPFRFELQSSDEGGMSWVLPVRGKGVHKRICYFEKPVNAISAKLSTDDGKGGNLKVTFTKLSGTFAVKRIDKKLINKLKKDSYSNELSTESKYNLYNQLFEKADQVVDYQAWVSHSEPLIWEGRADSTKGNSPFFSVIVPTYNAKPEWLNACFQSVLDQTYDCWELIVIDDASSNSDSLECLNGWQACVDPRIKIIFREQNGHICAATNTGLYASNGGFICFLDHDDMLAPQALNELAVAIQANPRLKMLYSDEDLISESGKRLRPHFKPDWNPELLLNHNYITHLCCYESNLVKALGGMRVGLDGAQDYDFVLRVSRLIDAENIYHIPKILYHWRMVEGSTALSSDAKSYATKAGLRALSDHMAVINSRAIVSYAEKDNFYKVKWPESVSLRKQPPKVSIVVPTRDGLEVLKPCIDGLLHRTTYQNLEIVVLDNGSEREETLDYLKNLANHRLVTVIRDEGAFNYSRINNYAVSYATGELVCLLNNDVEVIHSDWLENMVSLAIRPNVGCVGAKLLYPDDTIQHAGVILGLGGYAAHAFRGFERNYPGRAQVSQNVSAVTAACLLVKRDIYDAVGGLDEEFQVAYNDVDFCLRVKEAGYENIYTPDAELYHHESKTRGSDATPENSKRFEREKALLVEKWSEVIKHDPAYNPNLTRSREDFSIGSAYA